MQLNRVLRALKSGHFGSFHNSDVAALLQVPLEDLPRPDPSLPRLRTELLPACNPNSFGTATARALFMLDLKQWTFVNHGAFGATLAAAHALAEDWRAYQERQPLRFYDRVLLPELARRIHAVSGAFGCGPSEVTLVANATSALNAAITHLAESRLYNGRTGDTVVSLDLAYGAVKTMIKDAVQRAPDSARASHHEIHVPLPVASSADVVGLLHRALENLSSQGRRPAFAVFDHVTSNTGVVLPVEQLAEVCQDRGIPVLVDGAHAPLQLPLNLRSLANAGVTHYVANCHKWLSSPKGCGLFFVRDEEDRHTIRPLAISHGYGYGFASNFLWDGCRDYAAALALPACFEVWQHCGGIEAARSYATGLARAAAQHLMGLWDTAGLAPPEMHATMACVEVPRRCYPGGREVEYAHAQALQNWLYDQHIEVPVKRLHGKLYVRISAHIYNCADDYRILGEALATGDVPR
jgi:selenocysteine lyase/cysteine desulfurase